MSKIIDASMLEKVIDLNFKNFQAWPQRLNVQTLSINLNIPNPLSATGLVCP